MINRDEIYHHGVSGMKWGKRNGPPYPLNAEGKASLAKQRKSSGRVTSGQTESETGLMSKKKPKEEPVKDYSKLNADEIKAAKEDAIRKGSIKEAYKNRDHYTDSELEKVKARYELNTDVKDILDADKRRGMNKVNEISEKIETVNRLGNAVAVGASTLVKIYNAVAPFVEKANNPKKAYEQVPTDKLAQYQNPGGGNSKNQKKKKK